MLRRLLSCALLSFCAPAFALSPSSDKAIGDLLQAISAGAPAFDGGRNVSKSIATPVAGAASRSYRLSPAPAKTEAPAAAQAPAAPADVQPTQAHGISDGYLGLYKEEDFVIGTGRCSACRAPEQGKWYFLDDVIATPKVGTPALIWLGGHELIESATLSADGTRVRLKDGTEMPFALVPKIESNRSFYDEHSLNYFKGRTLRMRGEFVEKDGVRTFVARSIWPEDYRIDAAAIKDGDAATGDEIDGLVKADGGGAKAPFQTKLLWENKDFKRDWQGRPVMGVMLNGAQGDDDEALAGHFSMFTGRYGPNGSMADWMFDNFYDMNSTSEKGIIASMVPMDKYMTDLNSGQSWYRPSDVLVMILKDARVPADLQELFKQRYAQYYRQDYKYDHNHLNCTALIADPVRAEGWHFPEKGHTPKWIAKGIAAVAGKIAGNPKAGQEIYESMTEEATRGFPRQAFDSVGGDLLSLSGAYGAEPLGRELSPLEKKLKEDLVAVIWVRLPQIPSSRKFGREAVSSVTDYLFRTGGKIKQTVPTQPRPFPPPH